ncbi:MAG: dihydrodipicolinate synthase family protein [Gemmatimonadetes bacterium]|nr:MAG: dihydrodipicolinate synthase family protein [Gemmatimonadota bacterium]PHX96663.1 MAG: dihydrodipicolinate synthase family protein [Gemmatimonadota bacterium]
MDAAKQQLLRAGCVIPAHPLALTESRALDERRQRALTRYYVDAGAGGVAVGVHTTQFAIRDRGLYEPVLALAAEAVDTKLTLEPRPFLKIAGAIGTTAQAVHEAALARSLGYDCTLLSLGALKDATDTELIAHCREVAAVMPLFGFYLQPAVGGRVLSYDFWRAFSEIEQVCAVKIAPFNRYQTLDVVRAVADSGRDDIALYTGNDDSILHDLVTPYAVRGGSRWIVGGLLGQWAVWTRSAVMLVAAARAARAAGSVPEVLLREGAALTDANSALFDVRHRFAGCIAGIHELLRRQGLLAGTWCIDPNEGLSPGQMAEIDRIVALHPQLADDAFVAEHLDEWLR